MREFPSNYTVLLTGPPGVGKHEYCLNLVKFYLERGEGVVFITTERPPNEIKDRMKQIGLEIEKYEGRKFVFIDVYSYSTGERYEKGLHVDNPANLNLISVNLGKAAEIVGRPMRIFFDSLSTLFLHASAPEIKKFFGVLSSRVKAEYGFIIYTLQEEMHDEQTVIALKHITDAVLETKFEEGPPLKRKFRVHHAKGITSTPTWYEFRTGDEGFQIIGEMVKEEEVIAPPRVVVSPTAIKAGIAVAILILGAAAFYVISPSVHEAVSEKPSGPEVKVKITPIYSLDMGKTVRVNGKDEPAVIDVKNRIDSMAPEKGWLVMETPFYRIEVNLDHPYYLLYDKLNQKDVLVYNDKVESQTDMLTGSTLGYADYDAENLVPFSSMALHDESGIEYSIKEADKEKGFLLIGLEGWDFQPTGTARGYDVEGEELLALFADRPYFFDAIEVNNLQKMGYARPLDFRSPDGIVKDWVLRGDYDSACIVGGDPEHLNKAMWEEWYQVQTVGGVRKPWHAGSAAISKMFPDHVIVGNKLDGGIVFSLPQGKFRFDDALGPYGAQVALEFLILVERPQKAIAFTTEPVTREGFLYDVRDYETVEGYKESVREICNRYQLECPEGTIDAHAWETKRLAYVITLTKDWYEVAGNKPKSEALAVAEEGLEEFKNYEDIIYKQMEATKPLVTKLLVR